MYIRSQATDRACVYDELKRSGKLLELDQGFYHNVRNGAL